MKNTELRTITLSVVILLHFHWSNAQNEPVEVEKGYKVAIKTSGICEMCKETLEYDLAFEKGVKEATLNLDDKVMTIVYNPKKTNPDKLRKRITKIGYHADWLARDSTAYQKLPFCCKDGSHGTPIPQVPLKTRDD
ncbi:MAG: heavy-metal-associated domain-containing protein [Ekhidna sp.]|nr:heavy-metal-associated domain-containing protein [Ekhidna sp.]MBC6410260.1 heavy-metal-associated domain-containing protein [Ekhidna sp.]MBC6426109.1 heavy-metal-associated domain-containing protein [Ekhidna sp.]